MTKPGRNDACPCGSCKKYKKCCLAKDERQVLLRKRVAKITRADFVSEPYKKCPKCGKPTFGVTLHTGGGNYSRECTSCWHTENYNLPEIKKKVIYLDQFFISNIAKALDPDARSHAKVLTNPFWEEVYRKLDVLSKQNLISCPDSSFHTDESLMSGDPPYDTLKEVYEHLSQGCTFFDHNTITRFQTISHFQNYLNGHPEKPLVLRAEDVVHGRLHEWTGRMRIGVNMRPYDGQLEGIHKERKGQFVGLKKVFERWQTEKEKSFGDWFREEGYAFGEGTIKAHVKYLQQRAALPQKLAEDYLHGKEPDIFTEGMFPPPSSEIISDMLRELRAHGLEGEEALKRISEYMRSKHILDIPVNHISAMLFAGIARKAAHGQKEPPNAGTVTDINAIASLLPYCDAIFVDNVMAALLNEQPIKKEVEKYGTKVFSLNTKTQFLQYLDEIGREASASHLEAVADAYGKPEPYMTLLINKKRRAEDERLFEEKDAQYT